MSIMAPHARPEGLAFELSQSVTSRWFDQRPSDSVPAPLSPPLLLLLQPTPLNTLRFLQTNKAPFNLCLSVHLIVYVHAPACKSSPCSSAIRGWNKPLLVLRAVRRWCVWFACGFCNSYVPKDGGARAVESGANSVPVSVHTFALFMSSELIPTLVI